MPPPGVQLEPSLSLPDAIGWTTLKLPNRERLGERFRTETHSNSDALEQTDLQINHIPSR